MLRALNRKSNFKNTNNHKRNYHAYLEEYKLLSDRSRYISLQMACAFENGEDMDQYLADHLERCISISLKFKKTYNLLKKLDENQEILKSDYDDEILEAIVIDKHSNIAKPIVTSEIYAKFDKFKQSIE